MEKVSNDDWIKIFNYLHPKDIENAANSWQRCENYNYLKKNLKNT